MSFYKSHAPRHREHRSELSLRELEGMKALRDAFLDVVRTELGWDEPAANEALPGEICRLFA